MVNNNTVGLVAGFGLLGAGLYVAYKKLTGGSSSSGTGDSSGGGGGFFELFGGGGSSSSGTSTGTIIPTTQATEKPAQQQIPQTYSVDSTNGSTVTSSSWLGSDYTPVSSAVSTFLSAGRTEEEAAGYSKALGIANELKQDYYVIDSTRNGTPVYNIISGKTGQVSGGGAGISYADAVAGGYESRNNLATITVSSSGKVTGLSNVKPTISTTPVTGTVYGNGTKTTTATSSSGTSSGGSGVAALVSSIKSGGTTSSNTTQNNSSGTVTTSTGFTFQKNANTNNSAVAAVQAMRNKKT